MARANRALLALVIAVAVAPAARADTRVASFHTPGCAGATIWRIGYRLYWTDDHGHVASRAGYDAILDHARVFAAKVGPASSCAVRVRIDVYDEGAAVWPESSSLTAYPPDTDAFQRLHGYDAVFARFPQVGDEGYSGVAHSVLPLNFRAKFPGSAEPLTPWGAVEPESGTLWHEWLHLVVGFYAHPRQGWPAADVHGACAHGYACTGIDERYFADLMTGRVMEGTTARGILPDEWAYSGTPMHAHHQNPGLFVRVRTNNAGWNPGVRRVVFTYADAGSGRRVYRRDVTHGGWTLTPPVPAGLYRVCLTSGASDRYVAGRYCDTYRVRRSSAQARAWAGRTTAPVRG
jgi:hypothetical protein